MGTTKAVSGNDVCVALRYAGAKGGRPGYLNPPELVRGRNLTMDLWISGLGFLITRVGIKVS